MVGANRRRIFRQDPYRDRPIHPGELDAEGTHHRLVQENWSDHAIWPK